MRPFRLEPRFDFGFRRLLPEWKAMLSRKHISTDFAAGLTVACVAAPLSLAIALASGVAPGVGLISAIVGGIVCALLGGTALQVSGPAAAMAVLVAALVQEHGFATLLVVGIGCGLLQLTVGALGLGRFIRLVPVPVIEGFTAGIGAIILLGQLPRALGLPPPPQSHVFEVVTHVGDLLHQTKPSAVGVLAFTLAVLYGLPKVTRRLPPHLVAVVLATILVAALGVDTETVGRIPRTLPAPALPAVPDVPVLTLLGSIFVVFALASLETLLSATAVDKLTRSTSDPDQELIGQGLGNVACALVGGIPITGVIARSGVNVLAGAKTRRASIFHSFVLLLGTSVLAGWMERIPLPALAAVLFTVAFRMLSPASFQRLWRHSHGDAIVYAITFATIVFVDLLEGIQWGIVAALVIAAIQLGRGRLVVRGARIGEHYVFMLDGPLTFMSSLDVDVVKKQLSTFERGRSVVFDVRGVGTIDASGIQMLMGLIDQARTDGLDPLVMGLDATVCAELAAPSTGEPDALATLVADERELATRLGAASAAPDARLRAGIERFRATTRPRYASLFEKLASGQAPHTLFITCSDSRIDPNLITSTDPGELFIVRDVGNLVPPASTERASAVGAAIDYSVGVLGVSKIVICGHSGCGAISALVSGGALPRELPNLEAWLEATDIRPLLQSLPQSLGLDEIGKLNVLSQIDHLRTYPIVAEKLKANAVTLAAWFFDVATGEVEEWTESAKRFIRVGDGGETLATVHGRPIPQH